VISIFGDEDNVLASIEAGALGYIHKDSTSDDIAHTFLDMRAGVLEQFGVLPVTEVDPRHAGASQCVSPGYLSLARVRSRRVDGSASSRGRFVFRVESPGLDSSTGVGVT